MKSCLLLLALLGMGPSIWAQEANPTEPVAPIPSPSVQQGRVISADERVIVYGKNNATITAVLSQVTALREELNFVIRNPIEQDRQAVFPLKNNLILTLFGQPGDPPQTQPFAIRPRSVEGSNRYRIELNIDLARGLNRKLLRRKILECILMDSSLGQDVRPEQVVKVAPWLIEGALERLAWRDGEADRALYKSLFKNGMIMSIEEMVTLDNPNELDAAERTAFRISAGAFFMAVVNQDGGVQTFLEYLARAPIHEGEPLILFRNSFFTAGLSKEGMAKLWALQLANLTQEFVTETLTPLATEKALTEILQGTLEDENHLPINYRLIAFQDILALSEEERQLLLSPMLERAGLLSFRCFPSYQSLLAGYTHIIKQLMEGNGEDISETLIFLEEKRVVLRQVGERTRDYLDWYQISNATQLTGEFSDYQRLKRELETQNPSHPSPIDRYLNSVQSLYDE